MIAILLLFLHAPLPFPKLPTPPTGPFPVGRWVVVIQESDGTLSDFRLWLHPGGGGGYNRQGLHWTVKRELRGTWLTFTDDAPPDDAIHLGRVWAIRVDDEDRGVGWIAGRPMVMRRIP